MRNLTWSGRAFIRILEMIPLTATDLPEPVDPATSKWGIRPKSKLRAEPSTALPRGTSKSLLGSVLDCSQSSRKETVAISELGTSIPTKDFPGIGASIRTSFAARARAKSSARFEIRLTRTPTAGLTSYLVTDGPISARSTLTSILKLLKVSSKIRIFLRTMFFSLDWLLGLSGAKRSIWGNLYCKSSFGVKSTSTGASSPSTTIDGGNSSVGTSSG